MRSRLTPLGLLAALAAAAAGCSDGAPTASVSGTVTYAGAPVEEGSIQFTPKDGKGAVTGTFVVAGTFKATKVPTGPMVVFVSSSATPGGTAPGAGAISSDDMARAAKDKQARKKADAPPPVVVPPDAAGNNVTFEVKPGANTLTIELTPPGGRPAKK